jgi:peptide/nickel transport system substrate-binding protein
MKSGYLFCKFPLHRMLLAVLATLFILGVGSANSAPEPGTVTVVLGVEPRSLDPGDNRSMYPGQVMMKNVLEALTEINPVDSSIGPGLATSWKQIDSNTWHFFLRKGVKFHDGRDFDAEAVVFNIKRIYDKKIVTTIRAKFFSNLNIEGKALSSHTLEIKTDRFEPLVLILLGNLAICSPSTPMEMTRHPIGTGPYRFVRWDAGRQIILERFDGYWGKQPQVNKAVYVWRNESSVRAAMVAIGEADLATDIARQDANRPDMDYSFLNSETTYLKLGGAWEPPFTDRRFRMALNYAVDRNSIRGTILGKDVVPATQVTVPSNFGYNPDLKVWPYDPGKARQLLDEARKSGVPVDKEIVLLGRIGIHPGAEELMEALFNMYKAVGLNVKLKMVEAGVSRRYQNKPYPTDLGLYLMQKMHGNDSGDAVFTAPFCYHCKGDTSTICDKTLDELIEKAQVATGKERKALWGATFKRIAEEIVPDVPLFHMVGYARAGNRINIKPSQATTSEIQLAEITFKQ